MPGSPLAIEFDATKTPVTVDLKATISEIFPGNADEQLCALIMTHNLPFFAGENRLSLVQTAKAIGISPAKITSLKSRWQLDGLWQRVYDRLVGHLMSETKITNLKILSAFPTIVDSLLERLEQTKSDKAFGELLTIYMSLHKDVATSADASMEESARSYLADTLAGKPGDIQESNVPPPTNPPTGQMQTDPADGDS